MEINDDDGRGTGRKLLNISDNEDDVLSLYAQSDYDLDILIEKRSEKSSDSPFRDHSPRKIPSANKSSASSKDGCRYERDRSPYVKYQRNRLYADKNSERMRSNGNRFMRGSQVQHNRDSKNIGYGNTRHVMINRGGNNRTFDSDKRFFQRSALPFGSKPNYHAQKRGILGDSPFRHQELMNQNQNPRYYGEDKFSLAGREMLGALMGDSRQVVIENDNNFQFRSFSRSNDRVGSGTGFKGSGNSAYPQRRILDRVRDRIDDGRSDEVKRRTESYRHNKDDMHRRTVSEGNSVDKSSNRIRKQSDRDNDSNRNSARDGNETEKSIPSSVRNASGSITNEDQANDNKIWSENENSPDAAPSCARKIEIRLKNPPRPKTTPVVCATNEAKASKSTEESPESPNSSPEESTPPVKKSRVNLPPSPLTKSVSQWVLSKKIGLANSTMSKEYNDQKLDISITISPDKLATVPPFSISSASGSLEESDTSDIVDERDTCDTQQIDFLERMVTPPIEVTYTIDAPPRPPNPGPIHLLSSNSNSPAASRPSSRSGRGIICDQSRAVTPDVPPRPANPPPPTSAPSPASTPEGMPPRPQNPGPPLDVSMSSMSRPSSTTNSIQSADRFDSNSVSSILPLSNHSKLHSRNLQAMPVSDSTSTHLSTGRIHLQQVQPLNVDTSESSCSKLSPTNSATDASNHETSRSYCNASKGANQKNVHHSKIPFSSGYDISLSHDGDQSAVVDLSKNSYRNKSSSPNAIVSPNDGQVAAKSGNDKCSVSLTLTPPISESESASLSFSTTVVSSSHPVQPSYLAPNSTKSGLLPKPESDASIKIDKRERECGVQSEEVELPVESESSLKEGIIKCLRNDQFSEGLTALKDAMAKMPNKFGDGDVYEVIEFFGQHDAFEHVVSAARLVRRPDVRLLEFLLHVTEQSPDTLKEKDDDLWLIFNNVLGVNPPPHLVDMCIKCFAAIGNWNKVWTTLRIYPSSGFLPQPTISLCLRSVISAQNNKHLVDGVNYLFSLSHRIKCGLDIDVLNNLWLLCAEKGLLEEVNVVDDARSAVQQTPESSARLSNRIRTSLMEKIVSNEMDSLFNFVTTIGQQCCQQYLDCFTAGFMVVENPISKVAQFLRGLKNLRRERMNEVFAASFCVVMMRFLCQSQSWSDAFELWRLSCELCISCERAAACENESQTSIALLCLEICVRHGSFDSAVSMLSESLLLGQPWTDAVQVRRRLCILQEIYYMTVETRLDYAGTVFKALLNTKETDQSIIPEYGRIIDLMTVYNNFVIGACHSGDLGLLTTALELIKVANNKQLIVKPTVLRYLVVACVRFKLHNSVKEFLQRGMTVSIYPTIDVHSNMLILPTDLATEEIAALLLLYLMLLKEYLVQAMQVSKSISENAAGDVDVHQACSITVIPNNVNSRDFEFMQRFQLVSTEYALLQRVQGILSSRGISSENDSMYRYPVDYLKSPISSDLSFEGGRSVLKLNTTEVYNNVYYIEPPSD